MANNNTPTITPALQKQARRLREKCQAEGLSCLMIFHTPDNTWMLANGEAKDIGEAFVNACNEVPEYGIVLHQMLAQLIKKQS